MQSQVLASVHVLQLPTLPIDAELEASEVLHTRTLE